ncbi:hypothetical protein LTR70_002285 [Exophiala xenobiotica]|uniref:Uncharacterized protein n=1 Tax=Lithohypha guttulata TaxID=1690604 RepID=A0ABR0KLK3_9EURO|nr:hypothetical protein LTR24_001293 [Lithohypha guttulata]KAK5326020.1 hypothetical protein LTR70_002285 [Exophiala xenobiotica]
MHKSPNVLTILTNPCQEGQSLVDDKVFQVLNGAIGDDQKVELWHFIIAYQDYPDPGILLRTESFARDIAASEPAEGDLSGSNEDKQRIFQFCNKLVESHVNYVRATAKVLGFELYDKLIDRFYGRVMDNKFNHFLAGSTPDNFVRSWPLYNNIKQSSVDNIRTWRQHQASASYNIEQFKMSVELKVFLAKVKTAIERYEDRQRKPAPKANIPDQHHRPSPQAQTLRLARAQRRASIEKRNKIIEQNRLAKNLRLKSMNLQNIHQLGDQTRICLPDYVIRALTDSQDKYQATLEENKDKGEVDGGNLQDVVQQMHMAKDGVGEDPLGGIIIPEGYVHLGSTAASGGGGGDGY